MPATTDISDKLSEFQALISDKLDRLEGLTPGVIVLDDNSEVFFESDYLNNQVYIDDRDGLINLTETFFLKLFKTINLEIIDGTYIQKDFGSKLELINQVIGQVESIFVVFFDSFDDDKVFKTFRSEIIKAKNAINYLKSICSNLFYNENKTSYSLSTTLSESFDHSMVKSGLNLISVEVLIYNIYLIKADHYLKVNDTQMLKNIELIYSNSKRLQLSTFKVSVYDTICKIINSKSSFLKKKVLLRKAEEILSTKKDNQELSLNIQSKNDYSEFSSVKILSSPNLEEFKPWLTYSLNHYALIETDKINIEKEVKGNELNFDNNEDMSLMNIHLHIRFNKDFLFEEYPSDALDNLLKIKKVLTDKLTTSIKDSFEEYCMMTNVTYCYNNILSFLEKTNNEVDLLKYYNELKENKRLKNRKNYFATGVVLKHYEKLLKEIFSNDNINNYIESCKDILSKCETLLDEYYEEQRWFVNHNNYIFILPREESTIKIDNIEVYIYSSFVLPTSSQYLVDKFKVSVEEIKFYQTSFKSIKSIKSSLDNVEELNTIITGLNSKMEERDTRTLELVALIGALLSFVAGSIPGFQFINTGLEALWFTIALGTSLSFFVFLLFILNKGLTFLSKGWWIVVLYFAIIASAWYALYSTSTRFTHQKYDKSEIEQYMDSINKTNNILYQNLIKVKDTSSNSFIPAIKDTL